jgi:MoaA/NifB/PqqE/SkfB family radical SAM enzyme
MPIYPIDCVLAVTYNCNSRCTMCDIWKISGYPELPPGQYAKLPDSLLDINISGGEPFLRKDLPEIISIVGKTCPKARIVISSNGFATEMILVQMQKIIAVKPDIGVAISIDGIGEMHDQMRGIPGGFDKAMSTVKGLQAMGIGNLRLGFTVTERNVKHLRRVYDLANEMGIQFTHSFAQSSEFYFGGKQNTEFQNLSDESMTEGMAVGTETAKEKAGPMGKLLNEQYCYLINRELRSWNVKRWLRAYFAFGMYNFITGKNPVLSNAPGRDFFFIDPSGIIYPSVVHNIKLGNFAGIEAFTVFWNSPAMSENRKKIDASKMPVWMICTARTAIKKHPFRVMWWILKNKLSGFKM